MNEGLGDEVRTFVCLLIFEHRPLCTGVIGLLVWRPDRAPRVQFHQYKKGSALARPNSQRPWYFFFIISLDIVYYHYIVVYCYFCHIPKENTCLRKTLVLMLLLM